MYPKIRRFSYIEDIRYQKKEFTKRVKTVIESIVEVTYYNDNISASNRNNVLTIIYNNRQYMISINVIDHWQNGMNGKWVYEFKHKQKTYRATNVTEFFTIFFRYIV